MHISVNQTFKCMEKACISKHDYEKSFRKKDFVLPLLYAWGMEKDWVTFRKSSASFWNGYLALKRTETVFSVLKFLTKKCKVCIPLGRSLKVSSIRVVFEYVYGTN